MVVWEVVGGVDKGGIVVREGESVGSKQLERLSTGALVDQLELKGERLQYQRLTGYGPETGWVSIKISGKDLVIRCKKTKEEALADAKAAEAAEEAEPELADFLEERCAKELAKPAVAWTPVGMDALEKAGKPSKGVYYGMEFPWDAETLQSAKFGPAWLTQAFHTAGTMPKGNRVVRLTNVKTYIGGGACAKMIFDVEYAKPSKFLHTKLFAKIPWPLSSATRSDRMASSIMQQGMELAEINASKCLESRLPFRIPRYYFGDVSNETTNFIIITERIPFDQAEGDNQIDPPYEKGRDWELKGSYDEYYELLIRVGAKMAGMAKAGKVAPMETMDKFFDNTAKRGPEMWGMGPHNTGLSDKEFAAKIKMGADFVENTAKALFPGAVANSSFIATYKKVLNTINVYTAETSWWCNRNPDYIAWSHGNLNVDNVFFWRDADKKLDVGVLDWGGAGTTSMGWKLWWWLYGCEYEYLRDNIDKLLGLFIQEYEAHGGPKLELEELKWQFILSALNQGVGLLGAVPQIYRMCKKTEWPTITERRDPRIANNIDGKNTLRIYVMTFISVCRIIAEWDVPAKLDKWLDEFTEMTKIPKKQLVEC